MRARLALPAEDGPGRRQKAGGQCQCLGAVEIDVRQASACLAHEHADIEPCAVEVPGGSLACDPQLRPIVVERLLAAEPDRDRRPAAPDVVEGDLERRHGLPASLGRGEGVRNRAPAARHGPDRAASSAGSGIASSTPRSEGLLLPITISLNCGSKSKKSWRMNRPWSRSPPESDLILLSAQVRPASTSLPTTSRAPSNQARSRADARSIAASAFGSIWL